MDISTHLHALAALAVKLPVMLLAIGAAVAIIHSLIRNKE